MNDGQENRAARTVSFPDGSTEIAPRYFGYARGFVKVHLVTSAIAAVYGVGLIVSVFLFPNAALQWVDFFSRLTSAARDYIPIADSHHVFLIAHGRYQIATIATHLYVFAWCFSLLCLLPLLSLNRISLIKRSLAAYFLQGARGDNKVNEGMLYGAFLLFFGGSVFFYSDLIELDILPGSQNIRITGIHSFWAFLALYPAVVVYSVQASFLFFIYFMSMKNIRRTIQESQNAPS